MGGGGGEQGWVRGFVDSLKVKVVDKLLKIRLCVR